MTNKHPGMSYAYETFCEKVSELTYEELDAFSRMVAFDVSGISDDEAVAKVARCLLDTAREQLGAHAKPEAEE